MIRDTFFSLHRFVNVCRKEMVENWKTYILRSVMVYGMLAIVFVWNGYYQYHNLEAGAVGMDPIWEFESRFFLWGLVIWGGFMLHYRNDVRKMNEKIKEL